MARRGVKGIAFCIIAVLTATLMLAGCKKDDGNKVTVDYVCEDGGSLIGNTKQTLQKGSDASSITAVPDEGFMFIGWMDGIATATRQDKNITTSMTMVARFATAEYSVQYKADGEGYIEGKTNQTVIYGEDAESVTAVAKKGHFFRIWSDGSREATRKDNEIKNTLQLKAFFDAITYKAYYYASEGGWVQGGEEQWVEMFGYSRARAMPDEDYEFVKWSDGITDAFRKDYITAEGFEVTAIFKKKEFAVNYTPNVGGSLSGQTEQNIVIHNDAESITAVPNAGFEFVSWSDGVMTSTRQDKAINREIDVRATFAPIGGPTYKVLMVFVDELHVELKTNKGELVKGDYKMSDTERRILELLPSLMEACLNDMTAGKVRFTLDSYFTTIPLGNENMQWGDDSGFYSYGIDPRKIPEINGILESYASTMTTFCMNDYEYKIHSEAGSGLAKYAYIHLEDILRGILNYPLEELLDFSMPSTHYWWKFVLSLYTHEFTHTIEMQVPRYDYHYMEEFYARNHKMWGLEVTKLYLRNEAIVEGLISGVPMSTWQSLIT